MKLINPLKNSNLEKYPKGNQYQGYGENIALYMATIGSKGHTGIDLAMPEGTPVLAAHDGIVVEVKDTPTGYGKHIRLVSSQFPDKTYWYTVYGHLGD
ncbi:MAG: M23 family metallopeptidase, partial [Planctomycetota bacterium]|nr:M23 family metallopeptidase [Planctomycetota bacterium]